MTGPEFFVTSVDLVPAPDCAGCGCPMVGAEDGYRWECVNESCDQKGERVHLGVYPIHRGFGGAE